MSAPVTPGFKVLSPFGELKVEDASVTNTINQGISWGATVQVDNPLDYIASDFANGVFRVAIRDDFTAWTTPPLICSNPTFRLSLTEGWVMQLSGHDLVSWKMTRDGHSVDTFLDANTSAIVANLQAAAGVDINGFEHWDFQEEDIKSSKLLDAFNRLLSVAGMNYRINGTTGQIDCFRVSYMGPTSPIDYDTLELQINEDQKVDYLIIEKTSRVSGGNGEQEFCYTFDETGFKTIQLPGPMMNCFPIDKSTNGIATLVSTFHGDPASGGELIQVFTLYGEPPIVTTPTSGQGKPATHATIAANEPEVQAVGAAGIHVKVCFLGSPYNPTPPGATPFDLAFKLPLGNEPAPMTRPAPEPWVENLFPHEAFANSRKSEYFYERNKGYKVMRASGALCLSTDVGHAMGGFRGFPTGRVETITHSISAGDLSTSLGGFVPWSPV